MYTQKYTKKIVDRYKGNSMDIFVNDRKLGGIGKPLSEIINNNIMYRVNKEASPYA